MVKQLEEKFKKAEEKRKKQELINLQNTIEHTNIVRFSSLSL